MDSILSVLTTIAIIFGVVMLFNFMIFIHELGHFFAARWRGLYVDRFQIWFGRPIWKKTVNGVQWGLGWIPQLAMHRQNQGHTSIHCLQNTPEQGQGRPNGCFLP